MALSFSIAIRDAMLAALQTTSRPALATRWSGSMTVRARPRGAPRPCSWPS